MKKTAFVSMWLTMTSCTSPGFEDRTCRAASELRDAGEAPSWPVEQDERPAAGGPTLTSAHYKYIADECPTARFTVTGELGEGEIGEEGLRDRLVLHVLDDGDERDFFEAPSVRITGTTFEIESYFCGAYWYARRPGDAAWAHLEDDDGRGSNAVCVTVSAAPGVSVPEAGSGP